MDPEAAISPGSSNHLDSIDLSLELENSLDLESPTSPQFNVRPPSLDASVLVSIITQLRLQVAEITKERDDFLLMLEDAKQKQGSIQDNLQLVADRSSILEQQLSAAQDKHKEDEDAISMLRAKVEESRRGLMRLQTESRRASQLSSDQSSKRRSLITPLPLSPITRTHRRFASHSDSGFLLSDALENGQLLSPLPADPGSPSSAEPGASRFRQYSSRASSSPDPDHNAGIKEIEMLKAELSDVKNKLEGTIHELSEANEAREASEQCAKALRDYITDNQVGEDVPYTPTSVPPSPLPAFVISKSEEPKSSSKWSFRLWNGANGVNPGATSSATSSQQTAAGSGAFGSPLQMVSSPPLSKKLGGFFGARAGSISSISHSTVQSAPSPQPAQIPSMYGGGSDVSSFTEEEEPMSPVLGSPGHVIIRDSIDCSVLSDFDGDLTHKMKERVSGDEGKLSYQSTPKGTHPVP